LVVYLFVKLLLFFFFQAEDGIRDFHVTGVQTCALPIFLNIAARPGLVACMYRRGFLPTTRRHVAKMSSRLLFPIGTGALNRGVRSEERRVGKRVDSGGWRIAKELNIRRA